ncbi:MAG TPA: MinD/ParA family protein [Alphaproteobacteria bacterium]|nr:MinD/ParA family protein [Alphaproteobacteria bacterium]
MMNPHRPFTVVGNGPGAAPLPVSNVIAVSSGKGGVGKTWLSVTLCHVLARSGARVLLFDGDLGLANVDIQIGLAPKHDLSAVISGRRTLSGVISRYEEGGFDIIAGQSGAGGLASLPPARLVALRDELMGLARQYDWLIIDIGAGIDRTVRTMLSRAGIGLVVTTDEPTALTDAYALIKVVKAERPDADLRAVVNLAASSRDGERTYATLLRACENFLKCSPPLAGVVRNDPHVRDSVRQQAPLLMRYPNSDAAADVAALINRMTSSVPLRGVS